MYHSQPSGDGGAFVAPEVEVDDDDGEERRQRDENHVQAVVRTCSTYCDVRDIVG